MSEVKGYEDYVEDIQEDKVQKDDILSRITAMAKEMQDKETEIANAELAVKRLKAQFRDISETKLPELFEMAGFGLGAKLTATNGLPLSYEQVTRTSIAGAKKAAAIEWLDEQGHGGIVSRNVVIGFNKTQQEKVDKLLKLIGKGWPNNKTVLDVNGATVKALIVKLLKDGDVDVPLETFGVHQANVVKISSK